MDIGNKKLAGIVFVLAATACQPVVLPAPTPPPVVIPPPPAMPLPPGGAASSTVVPPFGVDGVRVTPNRGLSRDEHIWNFRIALNVAALTCRGFVWGEIALNYNTMLKQFKRPLAKVNRAVDAQYRRDHGGRRGLRARDTQTTELYNYFSQPPVKSEYCDTSLQKSREVLTQLPEAFGDFSITGLNDLDRIFINFYDAYAQYEIDLAAWQTQYGPPPTEPAVIFEPGAGDVAPPTEDPAPPASDPAPPADDPATPG
ncbi:MAG: hypothetical protein V3V15_05465 [Sphingorhabdus sp.]